MQNVPWLLTRENLFVSGLRLESHAPTQTRPTEDMYSFSFYTNLTQNTKLRRKLNRVLNTRQSVATCVQQVAIDA